MSPKTSAVRYSKNVTWHNSQIDHILNRHHKSPILKKLGIAALHSDAWYCCLRSCREGWVEVNNFSNTAFAGILLIHKGTYSWLWALNNGAINLQTFYGKRWALQVTISSTVGHRHPASPLRRVNDCAVRFVSRCERAPIGRIWSGFEVRPRYLNTISNGDKLAISCVINPHVVWRPSVVVIWLLTPISVATVASALDCVQSCRTTTISIRLYPINFYAPVGASFCTIAIIVLLKPASL